METPPPYSFWADLKSRWGAPMPNFWIRTQKVLAVIGALTTIMSPEILASTPHFILTVISYCAFSSAILVQFTKIENPHV